MGKRIIQGIAFMVGGFIFGLIVIGGIALLVGTHGYQKPFCSLSTAIELPNGDPPVPVGYPVLEIV